MWFWDQTGICVRTKRNPRVFCLGATFSNKVTLPLNFWRLLCCQDMGNWLSFLSEAFFPTEWQFQRSWCSEVWWSSDNSNLLRERFFLPWHNSPVELCLWLSFSLLTVRGIDCCFYFQLNDVHAGGYTVFPLLDTVVIPKAVRCAPCTLSYSPCTRADNQSLLHSQFPEGKQKKKYHD